MASGLWSLILSAECYGHMKISSLSRGWSSADFLSRLLSSRPSHTPISEPLSMDATSRPSGSARNSNLRGTGTTSYDYGSLMRRLQRLSKMFTKRVLLGMAHSNTLAIVQQALALRPSGMGSAQSNLMWIDADQPRASNWLGCRNLVIALALKHDVECPGNPKAGT